MQKHVGEHLLLENLVSTTNLQSLAHGYILNCRSEGKSPKTIITYQTALNNFIWYCKQNNFPDTAQKLNAVHVRQFIWYLTSATNRWGNNSPKTKQPASQTTANDYYRALHSFFNWLERESLIKENPFANLHPPKVERKVIQALTPIEIDCLFNACSGKSPTHIRNKAILCMFLDTGLRVSELASLNIDDMDMNSGSIVVRHGKGGKQRVVHIGSKAQKALWKYVALYRRRESNRLFLKRSGEQLDVQGIKILVKRLGIRAKVAVSPHKLRHTFAISYLRAGGDVFSLQYLLGHSTLQMTQRYLQSLNADDAIEAHRKFSPLDRLQIK
jgi:site-specific recombinase XerD